MYKVNYEILPSLSIVLTASFTRRMTVTMEAGSNKQFGEDTPSITLSTHFNEVIIPFTILTVCKAVNL